MLHHLITESRTCPVDYYRAMFSYEADRTMKVKVPTLLVWGEPDMALETKMAELSREFVPDLRVKVIANSSHFVHQDKAKETNEEIWKFLKE